MFFAAVRKPNGTLSYLDLFEAHRLRITRDIKVRGEATAFDPEHQDCFRLGARRGSLSPFAPDAGSWNAAFAAQEAARTLAWSIRTPSVARRSFGGPPSTSPQVKPSPSWSSSRRTKRPREPSTTGQPVLQRLG